VSAGGIGTSGASKVGGIHVPANDRDAAPSLSGAPSRPWLARYPAWAPAEIPIPNRSLPDLVEEAVGRWSRRSAVVFYGSRWSYAELWDEAGRFAAALVEDGFRPDDRLALHLPNCPLYPFAFLGALRAGLRVVPLSPLYVQRDLEAVLRDARPKGIVTLDVLHRAVEPHLDAIAPERVYVAALAEFYPLRLRPFVPAALRKRGFTPGMPPPSARVRSWHEVRRTRAVSPRVEVEPSTAVAVLQYTGGTTGIPKAAMLSHRNLVANALQCRAWFSNQPEGTGVVLAAIPFFHVYGMTVALDYPLVVGSTIVLQLRPDAGEMLRLIARHRPTELPGAPALYRALLDRPDLSRYDVRSIRVCVSGSAPLPAALQRRFEAATGARLVEGYGLTEASPVTHANPIDGERREGSIGLPIPSTEQRVIDLDDPTRSLAAGETGELAVRGPQVMLGYYGRPEETSAVLRDGWLLTGDIARVDAEGYAYIVDRRKDMIDVGGLKVYPREVEEALLEHPAVAEAAAFGAADPALGEVVRAAVVLRTGVAPTEAELIAFVRSQIAHYKAPRSIEFRDSLPRSHILKVLRRELRSATPDPAAAPSSAGATVPGR
jgi:long-chain acyl-CoA synthetase